MAAIAFIRGDEGASGAAPGGQMKVMRIMILAAQTPAGWHARVRRSSSTPRSSKSSTKPDRRNEGERQ